MYIRTSHTYICTHVLFFRILGGTPVLRSVHFVVKGVGFFNPTIQVLVIYTIFTTCLPIDNSCITRASPINNECFVICVFGVCLPDVTIPHSQVAQHPNLASKIAASGPLLGWSKEFKTWEFLVIFAIPIIGWLL